MRKWAHIGLFAILGCCAVDLTVLGTKLARICFFYAVFDEIHQLFVIGRNAKFLDVLIDSIGFLTVIIAFEAIKTIKQRRAYICRSLD